MSTPPLQLDKTKLLQLIAGSLDLSGVTPAQVSVTVRVPGGGDWSNTDLDLGDHPIDIRWTETEESSARGTHIPWAVPDEPGAFEGDVYYGDPSDSTKVTASWLNGRWVSLNDPSPQSPTAASADDVAARPPVAGLTLAEAQEADYILVVKGDTIKFLKDKRGNSTALDLVDPKEAYEITKEGARCRDTPGAVNPYPANTMKSQLHSQGWLTRDLQLCLARSNPRYRAQQLRGGSITEEGIRGGYGFESHTVFVEDKA